MHRYLRCAWAPPPLPRRAPPPPRRAARCCAEAPASEASTASPAAPDPATVALAVSAALVLHVQRTAGAAALSPAALGAYREAKGAPDAAGYAAALRAARQPRDRAALGAGDGKSARAAMAARQRLLHRVCNGEGDATYEDPETGYTVFSAIAHLRRGHCCGVPEGGGVEERTHRCRHCPYAPDGRLTSPAYRRLKERIPLVDAVRRETAAVYGASARAVAAVGGDSAESADEEGDGGCVDCKGTSRVLCTRCKGYKFLISPDSMLCPQCEASGEHPCMTCTPWTPRQRTEFGS